MHLDQGPSIDRRRFLRAVGGGLILTPAAMAVLASCVSERPMMQNEPHVPIARRDAPVRLPIDPTLSTLPDARPEEGGPLRIFGWPLYVRPSIMRAFEERYSTRVEWTEFDTMNEALARLRVGGEAFDLFFPSPDMIGTLARAGLLMPLNHSYIPNLTETVWPELQNPFYDLDARYSVPYMVWTTGIAWRNDRVDGPGDLANPYDIFWDPTLKGRVHVLSEPREVIGMALLRNGVEDVNTDDPAAIAAAKESLLDLVDAVAPGFDHVDYKDLYSGEALVHQSWSGNIGFADGYAPEPSDVRRLSYWWPGRDGRHPGIVGSDTFAVLRTGRNPVLAHRFIDMLLEPDIATLNVDYEGAQQPLNLLTPEYVLERGLVPPNLADVPTSRADFARGRLLMELTPQADALWQLAWREVVGAQENTAAIP